MSEISILLVHGELHGAWCWRDVLPELQSLGLHARAIDLPGHGADPTPVEHISMESYARAVLDSLGPKCLLVGHGMGGFPISAAAEAAPDRVAGLVYVSAYIPTEDQSILDLRAAAPSDPLNGKAEAAGDGLSFAICPQAVDELLYHDCPPGVLTYAAARINREPIAPLRTPLNGLKRAASLPRYAIITEEDQMIAPDHQVQMAQSIPEASHSRLATSHAAFFSNPRGLAIDIARISSQL